MIYKTPICRVSVTQNLIGLQLQIFRLPTKRFAMVCQFRYLELMRLKTILTTQGETTQYNQALLQNHPTTQHNQALLQNHPTKQYNQALLQNHPTIQPHNTTKHSYKTIQPSIIILIQR